MNQVTLHGHVGKDPEIFQKDDYKTATFSLATSESWKDKNGEKKTETTWHKIVVHGKQADVIEKFITKGMELIVNGKQCNETYENKDGEKRSSSFVRLREFHFCGGGKSESKPESEKPSTNTGENLEPEEDDLPFS